MPPPHDGNVYLPFAKLIELKRLDDLTFQSIALPFSPAGELEGAIDRTYGGHVYAQAAYAACQTLEKGLLMFNAVGTFLLPGKVRVPFTYKVQAIRDGRSFSTRLVHATQGEDEAICFTALVFFKRPETSPLALQEQLDLWKEYRVVLEGRRPEDFPEVPGMDTEWYLKLRRKTRYNDAFPGLENRQVDMSAYNKDRHPLDRRALLFYRTTGHLPQDPNLHMCAHLYHSDRNSLFHVTQNLDVGELYTQMSTLVHSVSFHSNSDEAMFGPSKQLNGPMDNSNGRKFAMEDWTTDNSNGRSMFHARVWASDGTQVATITQDGLLRYTKKVEATEREIATLCSRVEGWKPRQKL